MLSKSEFILKGWPRWRFVNGWRADATLGVKGFCLLNVAWDDQFFWLNLFNFYVEYNKHAE